MQLEEGGDDALPGYLACLQYFLMDFVLAAEELVAIVADVLLEASCVLIDDFENLVALLS